MQTYRGRFVCLFVTNKALLDVWVHVISCLWRAVLPQAFFPATNSFWSFDSEGLLVMLKLLWGVRAGRAKDEREFHIKSALYLSLGCRNSDFHGMCSLYNSTVNYTSDA
jgi:hypothetical protein